MDKTDHLMAEKSENNKDSQKGQVTPKKYFKKYIHTIYNAYFQNSILLLFHILFFPQRGSNQIGQKVETFFSISLLRLNKQVLTKPPNCAQLTLEMLSKKLQCVSGI